MIRQELKNTCINQLAKYYSIVPEVSHTLNKLTLLGMFLVFQTSTILLRNTLQENEAIYNT